MSTFILIRSFRQSKGQKKCLILFCGNPPMQASACTLFICGIWNTNNNKCFIAVENWFLSSIPCILPACCHDVPTMFKEVIRNIFPLLENVLHLFILYFVLKNEHLFYGVLYMFINLFINLFSVLLSFSSLFRFWSYFFFPKAPHFLIIFYPLFPFYSPSMGLFYSLFYFLKKIYLFFILFFLVSFHFSSIKILFLISLPSHFLFCSTFPFFTISLLFPLSFSSLLSFSLSFNSPLLLSFSLSAVFQSYPPILVALFPLTFFLIFLFFLFALFT